MKQNTSKLWLVICKSILKLSLHDSIPYNFALYESKKTKNNSRYSKTNRKEFKSEIKSNARKPRICNCNDITRNGLLKYI